MGFEKSIFRIGKRVHNIAFDELFIRAGSWIQIHPLMIGGQHPRFNEKSVRGERSITNARTRSAYHVGNPTNIRFPRCPRACACRPDGVSEPPHSRHNDASRFGCRHPSVGGRRIARPGCERLLDSPRTVQRHRPARQSPRQLEGTSATASRQAPVTPQWPSILVHLCAPAAGISFRCRSCRATGWRLFRSRLRDQRTGGDKRVRHVAGALRDPPLRSPGTLE